MSTAICVWFQTSFKNVNVHKTTAHKCAHTWILSVCVHSICAVCRKYPLPDLSSIMVGNTIYITWGSKRSWIPLLYMWSANSTQLVSEPLIIESKSVLVYTWNIKCFRFRSKVHPCTLWQILSVTVSAYWYLRGSNTEDKKCFGLNRLHYCKVIVAM